MNSSICLVECPRVQRDKTISRLLWHSEEPISSGGARRIAERDWAWRDERGFEVQSSRFSELRTPNYELRITPFPPSRASLATVCVAGGLFQHPASLEGVLRDSVPAGGGGRWIHVRL